jgi:hypothetical protein
MQKNPPVAAEGFAEELSPSASSTANPPPDQLPSDLVSELTDFFFAAAPRPVKEIAWVAAIVFLAGISGRAFNISGTGLNLYVLLIAVTGRGKESVSSGISKLLSAVIKLSPTAIEFRGPAHIASPEALLRWLTRSPCIFSIVGEFGHKLKEMSAPNAPSNVIGLNRVLLDVFSKSGNGQTFGAMAYADNSKNTAVIQSPTLTLYGDSTPETFFENVHEGFVSDGLAPRFMVVEYSGPRVDLNDAHAKAVPSKALVNKICDLIAQSQSLSSRGQVCNVGMSPEAKLILDKFEKRTTAQINTNGVGTIAIELWNRAHLKALKLAAIYAVGCNYINPAITADQAQRACGEIHAQTMALLKRFSNGEIGAVENNEALRRKTLLDAIMHYATCPFEGVKRYGVMVEMHERKVIPETYLQRRLGQIACFRRAREGSTRALKSTIKNMIDADEIREIPKNQTIKDFGVQPRTFIITKPKAFLNPDEN